MSSNVCKTNIDAAFTKMCATAGIKATQQRREIYHFMMRTKAHPDAAMLFRELRRRMPTVSLDTVYRNLHTLESAGIVRKVAATGPRARYEIVDGKHHHFICRQCGTIYDFSAAGLDRIQPPAEALQYGQVKDLQIELYGVCHTCLQK